MDAKKEHIKREDSVKSMESIKDRTKDKKLKESLNKRLDVMKDNKTVKK